MSEKKRFKAARSGDHPSVLPWYVAGTLEADQADRVKEHLDGCDSCREEVALLRSMRGTMTQEPHAELEAAEDDTGLPVGVRPRAGRRRFWLAAAAMLVVGFVLGNLLGPDYDPAPDGRVGWVVLDGTTRGAGVESVVLGPDQRVLPIGVAFGLPRDLDDETQCRMEVRDARGATWWSEELTAGAVRRALARHSMILILLSVTSREPGRHVFMLTKRESEEELVTIPFEISRQSQSPEATNAAQ